MSSVRIEIIYDLQTGTIQASHPPDIVLTLGLLERTKGLIMSKEPKASDSGIVGAKNLPFDLHAANGS